MLAMTNSRQNWVFAIHIEAAKMQEGTINTLILFFGAFFKFSSVYWTVHYLIPLIYNVGDKSVLQTVRSKRNKGKRTNDLALFLQYISFPFNKN